ncbi:MAG: ATP synthase F1 subunit epsilon [Bacteroidetes bacterium]|nr:ATP synthase F1 subunit epsilon [Bacteroidota bacterium]HET6243872.1 ATP synthase F1 subunit epsilon [Bacteroidia bacterium]
MFLEIITPDKKVYEGNVISVKLPGSDGSFGVMNNHAPIISTLDKGTIKIVDESKNTLFFDVNGGVVEVMKNKIVVLAESI